MRKPFAICISLFFLAAVPALSQNSPDNNGQKTPAPSKKAARFTGTVGEDGKTFVCDWDHRIWKIANDAILRERAGQHVQLSARSSASLSELFVTSVKLIPGEVTGFHLHDAAFRR